MDFNFDKNRTDQSRI
uniref:Uncharacterized protein n=1 Tax=Rhizophora mucronata TaxID=61149 RepID=A0A2P2PUZ8_RHIMU